MKTVKDYSLKCKCHASDHEICIGNWDDGQIVISVKDGNKWNEVVVELKELQEVLAKLVSKK